MLLGFLILLLCQLTGELLMMTLGLPIPGPVAGMLILFVGLLLYGSVPRALRVPAEGLIRHLSLLFVPAGVGLIQHFGLIAQEWLVILLTLISSTFVALFVTALVFKALHPSSSGETRDG
ncbi:CidA/LrgA family protein [Natronospirillum operosum]|uniref:CidA/LrgA family protein n=1 Tax=Natronospirillum operosum TaxID=2759953 RepID=A0A4Z0WEF3_9GAMM|nr:CidA/LrgA family protein [Natronospirillum operosum]TGG93311.1 CidA/LrgA family protein [Natronospirillum operosum]